MEAVDGSAGFDFGATYDEIESLQKLAYTLGDGRKIEVLFQSVGAQTEVIVTFDAESMNSIDMQRSGWQAILNNFKKHVENCASASSMVLKYPISTDRLITLGKYSGEITYEVIHCDSGLNMAIKSESTVPDIKPCK